MVAGGEAALQAFMTAVNLHRKDETVVTSKPKYNSKFKGGPG